MDNAKFNDALKKLKKKYGDSIHKLGDEKSKYKVEKWKTGIKTFDDMLEGGMPKKRIVEIVGPEGVGKTSICFAMSRKVDHTHFVDAEGTLDEDRAMKLGANKDNFSVSQPESGEEAAEHVVELTKASVPLIVVDSVPALTPHDFLEKLDKKGFENDNVGGIARLLSQKLFPSLIPNLKYSESTIVFINQVREKVGMVFGDPETTPGGRALRHYAASRIQIRRKQWYGNVNNRVGQLCAFRVVKSKVSTPYNECEIPLHFEKGFVSKKKMKELQQSKKG